jgi:hypothetical protein
MMRAILELIALSGLFIAVAGFAMSLNAQARLDKLEAILREEFPWRNDL